MTRKALPPEVLVENGMDPYRHTPKWVDEGGNYPLGGDDYAPWCQPDVVRTRGYDDWKKPQCDLCVAVMRADTWNKQVVALGPAASPFALKIPRVK